VKKIIQKILSNKRNRIILGIALILMIGIGVDYILRIKANIAIMIAPSKEVPYSPPYPSAKNTGSNAQLIQRGEYLAKAGDCIACHTNSPKKGAAFAGGLPMHTPFGTLYSPNITPDKETGIGNWTNEQFIKAMREGISPTGHYYYPAFPFYYFSKVTTDDLLAIKAYLDAIPAVHQPNVNNEMLFPFNWRFLQLGWRLLFFHPTHQSTESNQGAYLVNGLGHCAMCHSPSYNLLSENLPLAAPIQKYDLTGAKVQGYLAPNITKSNIGTISTPEIVRVFTEDRLIGGGKVEGPMLEVNHDSLRYLSQADLTVISNYLKTVESVTPPKPKGSGPGQATYENYCSGCHATGAGGAPKLGDSASWDPVLKVGMDKVYQNAINGIGGMPAKGTCISCSTDDIKQTVDYMVAAVSGNAATASTQVAQVPRPKQLSMEDGKQLYTKNCASCHQTGTHGALKLGDKKAWKPVIHEGFLNAYVNIVTGHKGHPARGGCSTCSDAELIAAIKYMMQNSSTDKNYELW